MCLMLNYKFQDGSLIKVTLEHINPSTKIYFILSESTELVLEVNGLLVDWVSLSEGSPFAKATVSKKG